MKVLLVPFTFYPDPAGGTEVYVQSLALWLERQGLSTTIAAPADKTSTYLWNGLHVRRFSVQSTPVKLSEMYGHGDPAAATEFDRLLADEKPDIVHLHAYSRAVSVRSVEAAGARGIPVVFTYHTPTITCQAGTMMLSGVTPCDGVMELRRCARCSMLQHLERQRYNRSNTRWRSAHELISRVGSNIPRSLGAQVGALNLSGPYWTALRMTELIWLRHAATRSLFSNVDHIVAVCQWVKDVLVANGIPTHKITLSRQGVADVTAEPGVASKQSTPIHDSPLRIAFLGRLDRTKGVHLLVEAIRSAPSARVRLVIYGVPQDATGQEYALYLRQLASSDERIEFREPVPSHQVNRTLRNFQMLAVPSQWLETGPLVVLEAFAAGIPVIGSRLGGISELVRDGVDGVLVDPPNVQDWAEKLTELSRDAFLVKRLRANVRPPRTMQTVANDMCELYMRVLSGPGDGQTHAAVFSASTRVAEGEESVFASERGIGIDRYGE